MFSCISINVVLEVAGDQEHSQKIDHVELHYDYLQQTLIYKNCSKVYFWIPVEKIGIKLLTCKFHSQTFVRILIPKNTDISKPEKSRAFQIKAPKKEQKRSCVFLSINRCLSPPFSLSPSLAQMSSGWPRACLPLPPHLSHCLNKNTY